MYGRESGPKIRNHLIYFDSKYIYFLHFNSIINFKNSNIIYNLYKSIIKNEMFPDFLIDVFHNFSC